MKFKNKRIQKLYFKIYLKIALRQVEKQHYKMVCDIVFNGQNYLKKLTPYNGPNTIINNNGEFVWKVKNN